MTGILVIKDGTKVIGIAKNQEAAIKEIRKLQAMDMLNGEEHDYTTRKGRVNCLS